MENPVNPVGQKILDLYRPNHRANGVTHDATKDYVKAAPY
jgi:hypothetical protein